MARAGCVSLMVHGSPYPPPAPPHRLPFPSPCAIARACPGHHLSRRSIGRAGGAGCALSVAWRPALRFPPRGLPRTHATYLGGVPVRDDPFAKGPRPDRRRTGVYPECDPIRLSQSDRYIALQAPSLFSRGQRAGFAPSRGGQRRACQTRRPWERRLIQPRPAQILARSIYVRYSNACRRA